MSKPKLVERRPETPAPEATDRSVSGLPDTLVCEQIQRVAVCAAIGAGMWTYGIAMDTLVRPLTLSVPIPLVTVVIEILSMAMSVAMFLYVRSSPHCHARKADAGLRFFVLNAAAVALLNTSIGRAAVSGGRGLSWNTVVILIAAMVLPATPAKMLVAAVIAAATDPIAVWIAELRGGMELTVAHTAVLFMPNFACAVVATLPSRALQRIGRRLKQAQEMGSYQLVELLGRGGMGEVWRARHRLLARGAAIKLIRPELIGAGSAAEASIMLRRFEQEAQATAALNSPHTIRIFDFGATADHTFYYVMELLEGRDLQSLVREFGPMPAERAVFFLRQVCHSLAEAHARGLVHRDVTPSNIYVCRMGLDYDFVKVLDFGLVKFNGAQLLDDPKGKPHTTTGTPAFMAPEIIMGGEIDQRADVYAIGCVAYYLLTGQPVFEAGNTRELFSLHVQATPTPPSQRTELPIPRELDALVLACLEKDPERRPKDAAEVLEALRRYRSFEAWDNAAARSWWERHLVELADPLSAAAVESSLVLAS